MVILSSFPALDLPQTNILSYLFRAGGSKTREPIWVDAEDSSKSIDRSRLELLVKRLGSGFEQRGLTPGDVCLVCSPNHLMVPVAYLSIIGYGAIFSGVNPTYTVDELVHQLKDTTPKLILVHPSVTEKVLVALKKACLRNPPSVFLFDEEMCKPTNKLQDWSTLFATQEDGRRWQWRSLTPEEAKLTVASINYSSGTTGLPKGVAVSHAAIIANVEQIIFMRDQGQPYSSSDRPKERWVGFLPLYHAYGQTYSIIMALKLGVTVYVMKAFQYERFLWTIQTYKVTHLQIAPPIMIMLSKRPETVNYDLSSVQNVLCGAAPLSRELQNDVMTRFGLKVQQGWGMTEVTCGGFNMPGGMIDSTGSVGMLHPGCQCKLIDEEGREVGDGEPGELYYRGPNVCLGYWRNDVTTKDTFDKNGWLRTGDVARMNEKGLLWIIDRKKEMIKVNGLQVAPAELEALLLKHHDIADAAVVGLAVDDVELPRAYVVLKDGVKNMTERAVQEWVAQRVAKHKRLAGGVVFIEEVPKLASGKIQRKVMREWAKRDALRVRRNLKAHL